MAAESVEFELVSPESLLRSLPVAMVVVPGAEGDFGVLPRHSALISSLRAGVISIYGDNNKDVTDRIFVGGGVAEVTEERCTVLAEVAVAVSDIDRADVEQKLRDAREDLEDAKSDAEAEAARKQIAMAEAMLAAVAH